MSVKIIGTEEPFAVSPPEAVVYFKGIRKNQYAQDN
jgi:hypothetical protein